VGVVNIVSLCRGGYPDNGVASTYCCFVLASEIFRFLRFGIFDEERNIFCFKFQLACKLFFLLDSHRNVSRISSILEVLPEVGLLPVPSVIKSQCWTLRIRFLNPDSQIGYIFVEKLKLLEKPAVSHLSSSSLPPQ